MGLSPDILLNAEAKEHLRIASSFVELSARYQHLHPVPQRQSENVKARLERLRPNEIILCSIVKAELLYGARKSTASERTFSRLNRFFTLFNSLPFDDRSAAVYGAIRADLEERGMPIGPNDLMIATIALASDSILVSHNTREFGRIDNLKHEDWE